MRLESPYHHSLYLCRLPKDRDIKRSRIRALCACQQSCQLSPGRFACLLLLRSHTGWQRGHFLLSGPIVLSGLVYNTISLQTLTINELLRSVQKHIKNEQVANYLWIRSFALTVNIQVLLDNWLKVPVSCQVVCQLNGPWGSFMGHHLPLNSELSALASRKPPTPEGVAPEHEP